MLHDVALYDVIGDTKHIFVERFITSAEREVKDSCSSGMFQSCNFRTSECPEVASTLVRGIFEWFDVFF